MLKAWTAQLLIEIKSKIWSEFQYGKEADRERGTLAVPRWSWKHQDWSSSWWEDSAADKHKYKVSLHQPCLVYPVDTSLVNVIPQIAILGWIIFLRLFLCCKIDFLPISSQTWGQDDKGCSVKQTTLQLSEQISLWPNSFCSQTCVLAWHFSWLKLTQLGSLLTAHLFW